MSRLANKWLPLLLVLLLGLAPFGQVLADFGSRLGMPQATDHMHRLQPTPSHHAMHEGASCMHCNHGHGCSSDSACFQCGSCSVTLLPVLTQLHFASLFARYSTQRIQLLPAPPSLLYRPPRS